MKWIKSNLHIQTHLSANLQWEKKTIKTPASPHEGFIPRVIDYESIMANKALAITHQGHRGFEQGTCLLRKINTNIYRCWNDFSHRRFPVSLLANASWVSYRRPSKNGKKGIIKGGSAIDLFLSRERGKSKKNKRDGGWYANKWKARRKDRH